MLPSLQPSRTEFESWRGFFILFHLFSWARLQSEGPGFDSSVRTFDFVQLIFLLERTCNHWNACSILPHVYFFYSNWFSERFFDWHDPSSILHDALFLFSFHILFPIDFHIYFFLFMQIQKIIKNRKWFQINPNFFLHVHLNVFYFVMWISGFVPCWNFQYA